jgi:hypothetical protein
MFIYLIVNHVSGKYYVGQHKGDNLKHYLQQKFYEAEHRLKARSHLYSSMRKYGREAFSIYALLSDVQTRHELDQYERDFIAFLKSQDPEYGYNICRGGEGFTGPHSEKSKRKTSQTLKTMGHKPSLEATASSTDVRRKIQEQSGLWPGSPFKDMVGTIVNGVSILSREANAEDGDAIWLCHCTCGNTFAARAGALRSGHTKSCGCLKAEQDHTNLSFGSKAKDIAGTIINSIQVLNRVGSLKRSNGRPRDTTWSCRCKCGNMFVAYGYYLRTGHTKSCGCLRRAKRSKASNFSESEYQ